MVEMGGEDIVYKGIKLRIYPNEKQRKQVIENFGACRFVWNQMLNMQIERYKNNKKAKFVGGYDMNRLLPQLKREYPWLKESDANSLQDTCQTLAVAYQRFFKKISRYPKFKSRKYHRQSYKCKQTSNKNYTIRYINNHYLKLPKLGYVKYHGEYSTDKIKSATIEQVPTGKFYCVLLVECESQTQFDKTNKCIGLDMGLADLIIDSDGLKKKSIDFDKNIAQEKRVWERKLARRRSQANNIIAGMRQDKALIVPELDDFKNYVKARQMVAKINEKIANQRKDYLNKITTQLVKEYDVIVIEDLKVSSMLKDHRLARSISNQSWREMRRQLEYKCEWYGKQLIIVSPYKTSQVCSECGYDDGKHELDVREWDCPQCHYHHDRDINAARNILNKGLKEIA
mgnify:CR=1 FL=1